nr:RidA family protein [uncultured Lichenicoccus sp.]
MFTLHNPKDSPPPPGPLSWGIDLTTPRRMVFISGQVGADADGRVGSDFIEQCRMTWRNVGNVLRDAGMRPANIVRTGIFLSRTVEMTDLLKSAFNAVRVGFLGETRPASTMIVVHELMDPRWLIEIDAIAAD